MSTSISRYWAAIRMLLVMTVLLGLLYPLVVAGIAQIPGLRDRANGSIVSVHGKDVGSEQVGQAYTDDKGNPLVQYFQSRPSDAGAGYDPTATAASNLGPENVVDTLPNPSVKDDAGKLSQLSLVCSRSKAVGELEGVSGARPYCTSDGLGAVLAVFFHRGSSGPVDKVVSVNQACPATPFVTTWLGVKVDCMTYGEDVSTAVIRPVRGTAPATSAVPADAVTASGSGLDPDIGVAYADLQVPRIAKARGTSEANVRALVERYTRGRTLGFLGEPVVYVLGLNMALDKAYPYNGS
jgi:potassium-transporting ATPase KdpC subunit